MRIFITGANGQLGQALQSELSAHVLMATDMPDVDITDLGPLRGAVADFEPDIVLHCAAYTDVDGCALNPELAYLVNVLGTQNVALACREQGAAMVHLSTNEVFAGDRPEGYEEWMPVNPGNAYARTKAASELSVQTLMSRFYIVRTAWLYAASGKNFIHTILRHAQEKGSLRVVSDEVGNPTYVADLAEAIAALIETDHYGIYHLVNQGSCSRLDFAREALRLSGMDGVQITPILSSAYQRASTPPQFSALKNIAGTALGITLRSWQEALAAYVAEHAPT